MRRTTVVTLIGRLERIVRRRLAPSLSDSGVSTLEIVVIAVGLFTLATLLVAGITAAVNSRLAQIG
jgi:hypothetical protein